MRARLPIAFIALILAFGASGASASATTLAEPADAFVEYRGPLTLTSTDGFTTALTASLTVDCSIEPCTALVTILSGDYVASPSNDQALPLDDGSLSTALPAYGDLCALRWVGAGQLDVAISGDSATITRGSSAGGPFTCPSGATATASAATITGTLTLQTGLSCVATETCVSEPTATPTPTPTPTAGATGEPTIGELIELPVEPSILSTLTPVAEALTPLGIVRASVGALVLGILVAFPSALLDSATERIAAWFEACRARRTGRIRTSADAPPLTIIGWPLAFLGLLIAAFASAFVDPAFGPDLVGVRTTIAIIASFVIDIAFGWAWVALCMRVVAPRSRPRVEFQPLTLLIVAVAVVFSRLTGFEPGIIFGLIAGIGFGATIAASYRALAALLSVSYIMVLAVAAWIGYSALLPLYGVAPLWHETLVLETLAAVAITGASALPIALLPIRGLLGHDLWSWNKFAWASFYAIATVGFLLVLLPIPESWQLVDLPLAAWLGWYLVYAVGAVLVWLVVVRLWRTTSAAATD